MLSPQDNELMCRVGPGTGMGDAMRRYWLPALQSSDLPERNGEPKGVELLGERFIAWRDEAGRPGLYAEACLHRGASLMLARAEGDGLRCIYHGWKFAVDGQVLETPNVADPKFKERIKGRTFPVREAGGLLWVYLGPKALQPEFPKWPWLDLPPAHCLTTVHIEECNFVQVLEGLVDSSHLGLLHMDGMQRTGSVDLAFAKGIESMQHDLAPRFEVEDTDFGFHYAAIRQIESAQGPRTEARVAAFIAPCFVLNPNGDIITMVVPMSDERTAFFHAFWDVAQKINEEPLRSEHLRFVGLDTETLEGFGLTRDTLSRPDKPSRDNNFHQDRAAMRRGERWSGLPGIIEDDVAVCVSSGPLRDRTLEVLSPADAAFNRLYRVLLKCATRAREGADPVGLDRPVDSTRIAGANGVLTEGRSWRDLVPGHVALNAPAPRQPSQAEAA
ncbi:MAG: Rieske (2Fe-2S) domain protein [Rhizobacter sp.]|nr:Rieske (2Fe-2S) domain protein [Rhizobacter sp.]